MNGKVHRVAGAVAGVGTALVCRGLERKPRRLGEFVGALGGGVTGSVLPDLLEPATSSYHRRLAHGVVPTSGLGYVALQWVPQVRNQLDAVADDFYSRADSSEDWLKAFLLRVIGFLVDIANGFVTAIGAGYASHVVLDGFTRRSIPVLGITPSF